VSFGPGGHYARLVVLRHGHSEWNARNLFTGWANPELTEAGERESLRYPGTFSRVGRTFAHRDGHGSEMRVKP
jgi:broad specificity phosphatase PhoE